MSIGETLARARDDAGLTVAEVSARTRIREQLIRSIEHDEFGACGGDFYARGHIRAIATAVGIDSRALISEYDAAYPSARPVTPDELPRRKRRGARWVWPGIVVVLAVIGVVAYHLASGAGGAGTGAAATTGAGTRAAGTGAGTRAAPKPVTATKAETPSPAPSPTRPSQAPVPLTELTPAGAVAFGPAGAADGDNPQNASLALSGNPATPWHTDWYTTARFGNLKDGTGLLLDLGRTVTVTGTAIRLGNMSGADLELRAGTSAAHLTTVASRSGAGGLIRLRLASRVRARYLLIWFTLLPPDAAGTFQADISGVTVTAIT